MEDTEKDKDVEARGETGAAIGGEVGGQYG